MQDFAEIWNPFSDDSEGAVLCPVPQTLEQAYLRLLARKLGRKPETTCEGVTRNYLYGAPRLGASGASEQWERDLTEGEVWVVPAWITQISGAFGASYQEKINQAYLHGKAHGKSLLSRLASGDMSVLQFDDPRS